MTDCSQSSCSLTLQFVICFPLTSESRYPTQLHSNHHPNYTQHFAEFKYRKCLDSQLGETINIRTKTCMLSDFQSLLATNNKDNENSSHTFIQTALHTLSHVSSIQTWLISMISNCWMHCGCSTSHLASHPLGSRRSRTLSLYISMYDTSTLYVSLESSF